MTMKSNDNCSFFLLIKWIEILTTCIKGNFIYKDEEKVEGKWKRIIQWKWTDVDEWNMNIIILETFGFQLLR